MRTCVIPGCQCKHLARGYCVLHYGRWKRYGDPLIERGILKGTARRTLDLALGANTTNCVLWPHSTDPRSGYGQITIDSRRRSVHVVVCEHHHGERPTTSHEVAHSCGVRACVNWQHLRWATGAENQADRLTHGTDCNGERNPQAKLTEADVRLIRHLRQDEQWTYTGLAGRFNVSKATIRAIVRRRAWKSVA